MKMELELNKIIQGDWIEMLRTLPDNSIDMCCTSPPYLGQRNYLVDGQLGQEATLEEYVEKLTEGFNEVRRVLKPTGSLWLNLGDGYASKSGGYSDNNGDGNNSVISKKAQSAAVRNTRMLPGLKQKDLIGAPWQVALALRASGWYLRSDIIWQKDSCMPESCKDRCTKSHEYIFFLTKNNQYFYDAEAIKEPAVCADKYHVNYRANGKSDKRTNNRTAANGKPGFGETAWHQPETRNKRDVWTAPDNFDVWTWLMENAPQETIMPLWEKFISDSQNKSSVWSVNPTPFTGAHFATFPEKLILDCIKAGSSEYGCCADCGAPWERIVERTAGESVSCPKTDAAHIARGGVGKPSGTVGKSGGGRINGTTETIGWQPTCECHGEFVKKEVDGEIITEYKSDTPISQHKIKPAIIIDPFFGAGTSGLVARKLNRNFIGIELNTEYIKIAENRLSAELGMFL